MEGVAGLARAIAAGELSAREAVEASLVRIEAENPRLNALTRVLMDAAPAGSGALRGVPFTVKENIDLAGTPTTFGLRGEVPDAVLDAPHVAHLRAAGAVPVGRGNLPDLALRWHTESARYGVTVNPRDPALSPGGSSGGDAAAVASGMVPFAVGSDYGGSLRVPAAACGVYALRPTPGRFPMAGSVPPSMSRQLFATDGLLARSVEDLALIAPIMARPSPRDPRYTPAPWTVTPAAAGVTAPGAHAGAVAAGGPLAVAVVAGGEIDPGSAAALKDAAAGLEAAGHHVTEIEAPRVRELAELWRDLLAYDSGPAALPRVREFGCEGTRRFVEALLRQATPYDGPAYARALAERHMLAAEWSAFLAQYPIVLGPVNFREPWAVGHDLGGDDAVRDEWWGFRLTVATSALGLPAIAHPSGVQLIAARWQEPLLLQVAAQLD